ncbi:MAG: hypothetical protein QMC94_03325 [Anaerosomatales bacterium]|nr:hypothetical protein [Anaerosomatales bacterium]
MMIAVAAFRSAAEARRVRRIGFREGARRADADEALVLEDRFAASARARVFVARGVAMVSSSCYVKAGG